MDSSTIRYRISYNRLMRMAELADLSGVPAATIKWYLREGLLPKGEATARNQARYDEAHVRRLRLIRALVEVGGLTTEQTRGILALMDDPDVPLAAVIGATHGALARPGAGSATPETIAMVDEYLERRNWPVDPRSPARAELAGLLATMQSFQPTSATDKSAILSGLDPYAAAVEAIATEEVGGIPSDAPRELVLEYIVLGTVLAERTLGSLRRLAQEAQYCRTLAH